MTDVRPVRRALLAVYDKTGVVELARGARRAGRGARLLRRNGGDPAATPGLPVTPVEEVTAFPEMLDGRVKTLHPRIHGGLLADRRKPEHVRAAGRARHRAVRPGGREPLSVPRDGRERGRARRRDREDRHRRTGDGAGGREELRVRRRRRRSRRATTRSLDEIRARGRADARDAPSAWPPRRSRTRRPTTPRSRAGSPSRTTPRRCPAFVGLAFEKVGDLRYGENPHQRGALYARPARRRAARRRRGPPGQGDVVQQLARRRGRVRAGGGARRRGAAVIVKHNNPCGAARRAHSRPRPTGARSSATRSRAFGGIVAFHGDVRRGRRRARWRDVFTEVVVAPGVHRRGARRRSRSGRTSAWCGRRCPTGGGLDVRPIPGGALVQDRDVVTETARRTGGRVVARADRGRVARPAVRVDGRVAREVERHRVREGRRDGGGRRRADVAGRRRRGSRRARRATARRARSMASDAFFPFPDALEVAADAGVTAVIHPGGSMRDEEVLRGGRGARHGRRAHRPPPLPSLTAAPAGRIPLRDGSHPRREGGRRPDPLRGRRSGPRALRAWRDPWPGRRPGGRRPGLSHLRRLEAQGLRRRRASARSRWTCPST